VDPHPDPHSDPHHLVTWTCIRRALQSDKLDPELDPDQQQFADDKSKCIEFEPI
jgi:hypothetical protein